MATLYIRDVDDAVAETLKQRAAADGKSLSTYVAAELAKLAARPSNAQLVERLRSLDRSGGPTRQDILEVVADSRK